MPVLYALRRLGPEFLWINTVVTNTIMLFKSAHQGRINPTGGPRHHQIWGQFLHAEL